MEKGTDLSFLSTLLPFIGIIFIIGVGVILLNQHFQKNLIKQKLLQEELINQHQHELLKSSIQVQEDERKRIASDLHDELGAALSISRMHLVQLEQQNGMDNQSLLVALQNIRNLTESSLASMRRISHELMPPNLVTFGLINTLTDFANSANQTKNITLSIEGNEIVFIPWEIELGLYRISMELINNTLKHANASIATIEITETETELVYRYQDNGKGIQKEKKATFQAGLGHKSIEARVIAMNGNIKINNGSRGGFLVSIRIPIHNEKEFVSEYSHN